MSEQGSTQDREQFEREFAEWIAEIEREIESTRRSEILTAEDYGIVINARAEDVR